MDIAEVGVGTAVYQGAFENRSKVLIDVSNDKVPGFESVPRLVDKGYPYPVLSEYGFLCPKGIPANIKALLTSALEKTLLDPDTLVKLRKMGTRPRYVAPDEFTETTRKALESVPVLLESNRKLSQ